MRAVQASVLMWTLSLLPQLAVAQTPTHANVEYARVNNQPLRLDLYLPSTPSSGRPLVIFVHGGGWNSGSKTPIQAGMLSLLQQGIALVSVDYRLVNAQQAALYGGNSAVIFPAAVHDVKAAIRFLRANSAIWGLDPQRFGLWGSSAGSHLATLVALSTGNPQLEGTVGQHLGSSSAVQVVVDAFGPSDILRMGVDATQAGFNGAGWDAPNSAHAAFIGCGAQGMGAILSNLGNPAAPWPQCVAQANLANPVLHIDAADPPVWIGHADNDSVVPWTQSQRLFNALQSAGVTSTFVRAGSGGHQLQEAQYAQARSFVVGVLGGGATLSPASLTFSATVTAISAPQIVTFSNPTATAIAVNSLFLGSRFSAVAGGSCGVVPFSLAAGSSCTQRIVFSSTNVGSFPGTLSTSTTPAAAFTPSSVSLSGTASAAALNITPERLSFSATVTATSAAQALTLRNTSDVPISITSLFASTRFLLVAGGTCNAAPIALGAGQSCTQLIAFNSPNMGSFDGLISITTVPGTVQSPATVQFTGTATSAAFSVSPASLSFNATATGISSAQALTLSNTSDVPISITNLAASTRFVLVAGGTCSAVPIALSSSQSCTVLIAFSSPNIGSNFNGVVTITTQQSTTQTPGQISLLGSATALPALLDPVQMDFGAVQVSLSSAPRLLSIGNVDSSAMLVVSGIQFSSPSFARVVGGSCPAGLPVALPTAGLCTIALVYSPLQIGPLNATVQFLTTPAGIAQFVPSVVSLSGNGTAEPPLFRDGFDNP